MLGSELRPSIVLFAEQCNANRQLSIFCSMVTVYGSQENGSNSQATRRPNFDVHLLLWTL